MSGSSGDNRIVKNLLRQTTPRRSALEGSSGTDPAISAAKLRLRMADTERKLRLGQQLLTNF